MKIIYTPADDDSEPQEFLFKPRQLFSFESEPIEEAGGNVWGNWDGFIEALTAEKGRALRAALWHERKKTRPETTFAEVIVRPGELRGYVDDEEIAEARAVAADPDTPDEIRQGIWAALGKGDDPEPSGNGDSGTDSTSPTPESA